MPHRPAGRCSCQDGARRGHTIVRLLREQEASGENVQEFCRKQSIATATFYRWKRQMGGMDVSDAQRLKHLERENSRLKKLVAERDLEIEVMKEIEGKKW